MKNGIKIGKYIISPKLVIALAAVIIVIIAACAGVASARKVKAAQTAKQLGCTFDTEGFEDVADVVCLNETMAVFTDSQGKKGIMALDGTVTQEANQNAVYTVSDKWRSVKYVCEGPLSEYLLLIDPETATVTSRQYHGPTEPEKTAYWSSTGNHLAWYDELGYAGEALKTDTGLEEGLYPVKTAPEDGEKYGFINENLSLEIALLYDGAGEFSEGVAPVKKGAKWGYINEKGMTAVEYEYDPIGESGAYSFRDGLAPVCKGGLCGIINKSGKAVVAFEFDNILQGKGGKYIARKSGVWGLITVSEETMKAESTAPTTEKPSSTVLKGNYKVTTSGSSLNLRAEANTNAPVLARIPNGTVITVTKTADGWAYTTYNSASGWVSADYITEIETEPETAAEAAAPASESPAET